MRLAGKRWQKEVPKLWKEEPGERVADRLSFEGCPHQPDSTQYDAR